MDKHVLSVLVENHAGVLSKVTGLFSRRGFNIDSLAVGETEDPEISRITIIVSGNEYTVEQIEKQLNKIIPVVKVKVLSRGNYISRTLTLFKVNFAPAKRGEILKVAEVMGAKIADVNNRSITLEFSDTEERTDTLEGLLKPYGIKEVVNAGSIALERGNGIVRCRVNKNPSLKNIKY